MTEQISRIRLLTRGDDMGAFRAGNLAIMDAFRNGILRNTSVMMPAPRIQEAATLLKEEPSLCIGLHITITSEWDQPRWGPISPPEEVPSLLDQDGYFFRTAEDIFERGVVMEELLREIQAQLELARKMGLSLSYLDEHMGIGWLFHEDENARLYTFLQAMAVREGLVWDRGLDYAYLPCNTPEELLAQLPLLTAGTYMLITHPAYDHAEMQLLMEPGKAVPGHVARVRSNNYAMLSHPQVVKTVRDLNIELVRYDQIASPASSTSALKQGV